MRGAVGLAIGSVGLAFVTSCGGDAPSYSLISTYSCLKDHGAEVTHDLDDLDFFVFDPIAREAGAGALKADVGANSVVVVFERSVDEAKQTEAAYKTTPREVLNSTLGNPGPPIEDLLRRSRNVVVLWLTPPTDAATAELADCLRE
jgi:hypothetical protein